MCFQKAQPLSHVLVIYHEEYVSVPSCEPAITPRNKRGRACPGRGRASESPSRTQMGSVVTQASPFTGLLISLLLLPKMQQTTSMVSFSDLINDSLALGEYKGCDSSFRIARQQSSALTAILRGAEGEGKVI